MEVCCCEGANLGSSPQNGYVCGKVSACFLSKRHLCFGGGVCLQMIQADIKGNL